MQQDASEHGRALSAMGAKKGGLARAEKLTHEERQAIARRASAARWAKAASSEAVVLQANYGSPDHVLHVGGAEIPCYVIEIEGEQHPRRVLVLSGMQTALNMTGGSAGYEGSGTGNRLSRFLGSLALKDFVSQELADKVASPIVFRTPKGAMAYGYDSSVLADICDVVLKARRHGKLNRQQAHIATQCEILMSAWARVGLDALIDEVTGYQYYRSRHALEEILEKYIANEWLKWTKTFPDDFYREMFRLRNWQYVPLSVRRPGYIGTLTNDIVYSRLAPGVLEELRKLTPKSEKGNRLYRYHQRLTEDVGHPKLREHLHATTALMKAASTWPEFERMLQRAFPKLNTNLALPIPTGHEHVDLAHTLDR